MFRVPGVSCPDPNKYFDSIYDDFMTFYHRPYPAEYPTFSHEEKLSNRECLLNIYQHLKKWDDTNLFKMFIEKIKKDDFQKVLDDLILKNPAVQQYRKIIDTIERHRHIITEYYQFLKVHIEYFIKIHEGYYKELFQNDGMKYLMTFPWTGVDLCLSYFLKNKMDFSIPHFYVNLSYVHMDNFLDCVDRTSEDKKKLVEFCSQRLMGLRPTPTNSHMVICDRLTHLLENDKDRATYQYIYANILQMGLNEYHVSKLVKTVEAGNHKEMCRHAYLKGVQSAFTTLDIFDTHYITEDEQWIFFARIAFILQLTDDLRDIEEDRKEGNHTLFSGKSGYELEETVRALAKFSMHYMIPHEKYIRMFNYKHTVELSSEVVRFVVLSSIHYSVIKNKGFFTQGFIDELEAFVPCYYADFEEPVEYKKSGKLEKWVRRTFETMYSHIFPQG